ncbi:MAG: hypothetical protein CM15mP130_3000 [Verrucomicrobiota bacterium]|nr:MAG: hypothetical protein CM15mP130_3000 [Verrucomicrobiota bacterium]
MRFGVFPPWAMVRGIKRYMRGTVTKNGPRISVVLKGKNFPPFPIFHRQAPRLDYSRWWVPMFQAPEKITYLSSALSSPSLSRRKIRSGPDVTRTPPFQNSKPRGLCTLANSIPGQLYHHCYHREESEEHHSFPSMVPTWDSRPGSCPQPTFRIDLHLNRIDQLRKLLLISKKINLKAVTNRKSLTAFFRA